MYHGWLYLYDRRKEDDEESGPSAFPAESSSCDEVLAFPWFLFRHKQACRMRAKRRKWNLKMQIQKNALFTAFLRSGAKFFNFDI